MQINAVNTAHANEPADADIAQVKAIALEIYCAMLPRPRFDHLGRRVGVDPETLKLWAAEGLWLQVRNERLQAVRNSRLSAVAAEKLVSGEKTLAAAERLIAAIHDRLAPHGGVYGVGVHNNSFRSMADALQKARDLQVEVYDDIAKLRPVDAPVLSMVRPTDT